MKTYGQRIQEYRDFVQQTGRCRDTHDKCVSGYSDRTGTPDGIKEDIVF